MLTKEKEAKTGTKPKNEDEITPAFIDKQLKRGLEKMKLWKKEAKEDYEFALGEQWTEDEKETLKAQGRPANTYNKIEPLLDLVGGYERENSARIKISPEGGEDKTFSEVMDMALKQLDKWTKLNYRLDHVFDDGIACGKGWLEMAISYEEDIINGDLIFRQCTPWQIIPDPDGKEYDQSDWGFIVKITKYSKNRLKFLYPKKETAIDELTADTFNETLDFPEVADDDTNDDYHNSKGMGTPGPESSDAEDNQKYWLKEYWHVKKAKVFYVFYAQENRLTRFDTKEEAETEAARIKKDAEDKFAHAKQGYDALMVNRSHPVMAQATGVDPNSPPPVAPVYEAPSLRVIEAYVNQMWFAASVAGIMLVDDIKSPFEPYFHGFPLFNFYAKYRPSIDKEELRIKGIVRNLKDPQRDINKSKSQFLHMINTTANSGWVGDDDALTPGGWEDLKKIGSTPGIVIRKKTGSILTKIEPSTPPQGQLVRMETAFQDIKECSGINSDALAMQDKDTSGRAIALRIKQAVTILSPEFRNFRWTKEMIGTAIFSMVPHIFTLQSLKKAVGQSYINANQLNDGTITAMLQQVADGKYDVEITEADNSATIRAELFDNLMSMAEKGMPIPPEVILQFSNIPNLKEVTDKINAYAEKMAATKQTQGAK